MIARAGSFNSSLISGDGDWLLPFECKGSGVFHFELEDVVDTNPGPQAGILLPGWALMGVKSSVNVRPKILIPAETMKLTW